MPLVPLNVPPGVWKNGSQYEAKGRYYDANLVRWKNGRLRPIGGWRLINTSELEGKARSMFAFKNIYGLKFIAIGTTTKLYCFQDTTSSPIDVTLDSTFKGGSETASIGTGYGIGPYNGTSIEKTHQSTGFSFSGDTITCTAGTDPFYVASTNEDGKFKVGDVFIVDGSASNDNTYSDPYTITSISSSNLATCSGAGFTTESGGTITLKRSRRYGNEDFTGAIDPNAFVQTQVAHWCFDLWDDTLLAVSNTDGKIYDYGGGSSSASIISSYAPPSVKWILVTPQKHLLAFSPGNDGKKIQWSTAGSYDQGSSNTDNDWYPSLTNTAGSFDLDTQGDIQSATRVGKQVLVFTDSDVHIIDYIGIPYIFSRKKVGDACGIIGPKAFAVQKGICAWMSNGAFFVYDGTVRQLDCEVSDYVFDDFNTIQGELVHAVPNALNNEIWWFYCSEDSDEIDRCVVWNYADNWWTIHKIGRTAMIDVGVFDNPIAVSEEGNLYLHELRRTNSGERLEGASIPDVDKDVYTNDRNLAFGLSGGQEREKAFTYAETGAIEFENGNRVVHAKRILTDSSAGDRGVRFVVKSRFTADSDEYKSEIYDLQPDGYTDTRITGRQLSLRIEAPYDQDFEIGDLRAEATLGGRR